MAKKILFVLHDGARSGAPIVLLHFLTWLRKNTQLEVTILLKADGPLKSAYAQLGDLYLWRPTQLPTKTTTRLLSLFRKAIGKPPLFVAFPKTLLNEKFDLIYFNTSDTLHLVPCLKEIYNCPIISHIHEQSFSINAYYSNAFEDANTKLIDFYIAASSTVYDTLVMENKVPREKIEIINEFISIEETTQANNATLVKAKLGLENKFIVGSAGKAGWRKGTDLFLQIANAVNKKLPLNDIIFLWIGEQTQETKAQSTYEVEKYKLINKVLFTGEKSDSNNYLQIFDIFMLTSREDPFPLVCLEAAALSKPLLCFSGSGGIPELLSKDIGIVVEYGNIDEMANHIIALYSDPNSVLTMGKNSFSMIKDYDIDVIAPKLYDLIHKKSNLCQS